MTIYRNTTTNEIVEIVPKDKKSVDVQELEISHHGKTVSRNLSVVKYTIEEYNEYISSHSKSESRDMAEFLGHGIMAAVEPDEGEYFIYICKDVFERLKPEYRMFILLHEMFHIYHDMDINNPFYFDLEQKKTEFNHRYKKIFYAVANKKYFDPEYLEVIWDECIADIYALSKLKTFIDYDYIYREFVCKCDYVKEHSVSRFFKDLHHVKRDFRFRASVMKNIMKYYRNDFVKEHK